MTSKKVYDIHERIFKFIVEVLKFIEKLPRSTANKVIIAQLTRSVTSMGANDQEADGAATRKEFVHRYSIVRKEGKETSFWLRLIGAINPPKRPKADKLKAECEEIIAIVSRIISNANKTSVKRKNE